MKPFHSNARVACVRGPIDAVSYVHNPVDISVGARVLFVGTTRGTTGGVVTHALEYEAHEAAAVHHLNGLASRALNRWSLSECVIVHRLGRVPVGEASVVVCVCAGHRAEAFAAVEWLMERVKDSVPIWKCEESYDGQRRWIHPEGGRMTPANSQEEWS